MGRFRHSGVLPRAASRPYADALSVGHQSESCAQKAQLSGCRIAQGRAAGGHAL